jgi:hypothetical protein
MISILGLGVLAATIRLPRAIAGPSPDPTVPPVSSINVMDYGAAGDGATDDTAAIHGARDAAGVGGTIAFPPGIYMTTGLQLTTASQMWQLMPGAVIKTTGSGAKAGAITVDASAVTITGGGTVDGNRSVIGDNSHAWPCITGTANASDLTIDGITVQNSVFYGVWGQSSRTLVRHCVFTGNYAVPIMLSSYYLAVDLGSAMQDTYNMEASDNVIDRTAESAETIQNAAIQIRGNNDERGPLYKTFSGKALRNTILMPVSPTESTGRVCGIEFGAGSLYGLAEGNLIVNGTMGISFAKGNYGKVIGNTLIGQALWAIEIADSPGCVVQGNVIDGSGLLGSVSSGAGIITDGTGLSTDITIVGNRIFGMHDNGPSISLSGGARISVTENIVESVNGIVLNQASNVTLAGNKILGKGYPTSKGVFLGDCADISVSENLIRSYHSGVQLHAASRTVDNVDVSSNHFVQCTVPVDSVAAGGSIGNNVVDSGNVVVA